MNIFDPVFSISGRQIGPGAPVYFIAEAGVSHFGDEGKARDLVDLAADAGADAFKTQAFITDDLISAQLPEWRDRLRPKEVNFQFIEKMKRRCDERGITFLCTAHDETALAWVDDLDVAAYKIGSGERGNIPFLQKTAERGKPIILSTGMYEKPHLQETLKAFQQVGLRQLGLLHCITAYPTPAHQVNLRVLHTLRGLFQGPVGYSDHTEGHRTPVAAVAMGADIIEKHITLDFDVPNAQDWKVSAGPDDLADLISQVRHTETLLGTPEMVVQECEKPALEWALKSLVATRPLAAGTFLEAGMLAAKRPGGGLEPSQLNHLIGRRLVSDVQADQALLQTDISND